MKIFQVLSLVLLLSVTFVAAQESTTMKGDESSVDNSNENVEQTTTRLPGDTSATDRTDQSTSDEQSTTAKSDTESTTMADKSSSESTSDKSDEQPATTGPSSESTTQNPCSPVSTEQAETTTTKQDSQDESTTQQPTTTEDPSCGERGDFCLENNECCGSMKCNMIRCAPCVTMRHGCDDDTDCCKGLKCVQVTPIDNNNYFNNFAPIVKKFNPSKQCLKEKKKGGKFPGFDWSSFVPGF